MLSKTRLYPATCKTRVASCEAWAYAALIYALSMQCDIYAGYQPPGSCCPTMQVSKPNFWWHWRNRNSHGGSLHQLCTINQSNFYSTTIPGEVRLSGATAESVFNSKNQGNSSITSTGHGEWRYRWGKGQVKEMCLQIFLKGNNWNGWTDRQQQVVPKREHKCEKPLHQYWSWP